MTHPDISAALARERVNTFLGEAQAARDARLARAARRPARGKRVVLRDGSTVLIRPVRSADAPLLADGFAQLSLRSRWMRFRGAKTSLSAAELRHRTDVDYHDHEAVGALSAADGRGVGIARYVRDTNDPRLASAVGEGAATIPLVHRHLARTGAGRKPAPASTPAGDPRPRPARTQPAA